MLLAQKTLAACISQTWPSAAQLGLPPGNLNLSNAVWTLGRSVKAFAEANAKEIQGQFDLTNDSPPYENLSFLERFIRYSLGWYQEISYPEKIRLLNAACAELRKQVPWWFMPMLRFDVKRFMFGLPASYASAAIWHTDPSPLFLIVTPSPIKTEYLAVSNLGLARDSDFHKCYYDRAIWDTWGEHPPTFDIPPSQWLLFAGGTLHQLNPHITQADLATYPLSTENNYVFRYRVRAEIDTHFLLIIPLISRIYAWWYGARNPYPWLSALRIHI